MNSYQIPLPDGSSVSVTAPEGWSRDRVAEYTLQQYEVTQKQKEMLDAQKQQNTNIAAGAIGHFGHGMMWGLNDEMAGITAGLKALVNGDDFFEAQDKETKIVREAIRVFGKDHPVIALGLEFGGGMLTGHALWSALKFLTTAGPPVATAAWDATKNAAKTLLEKPITAATAEGVAQGYVTGAPGQEDRSPAEKMNDMLIGGAAGAGLAKVFDVASGAIGTKGYQARKALEQQFPEGVEAGADRLAANNNLLGGVPDVAPLPYANVNPEAAQTAMTVAQPKDAERLKSAIKEQGKDQGRMVEHAMREITDTPKNRQVEADELLAKKRAEARADYDPLKGQQIAPTQQMRWDLETEKGKDAAKFALMEVNDARVRRGLPKLDVDEASKSFDFWHLWQQRMRETAEQGGISGSGTAGITGRAAGEAHGEIMDEIFKTQGQLGADYQQATKRYAENMGVINALVDSTNFQKMDEGEVEAFLGKMTPNERDAFKIGVVNDLVSRALRATGDAPDMVKKIIGSEQSKRNLRLVLGDNVYDSLERTLNTIKTIPEANKTILGGSPTQPRQRRVAELIGDKSFEGFDALNMRTWPALVGLGRARDVFEDIGGSMVDVSLATSPEQLRRAAAELENLGGKWMNPQGKWATLAAGQAGGQIGRNWAPDMLTPLWNSWDLLPSMGESYQFAKDVLTR